MSDQVRDMTKGSPAKLILLFAVPLMLGNIFQQLYTMVDTIVVGQVAGVQALAALGAVEWIMWMVLGVSTGVTQGFSILISQHYGARKWSDLKKAVAHSYLLTASVLRALGNSRTPLIAMLIASVINVVLDLVFVAGLHWGVAGAALATVTAQAFSALYCFVVVKKIDIVHTSRSDFEHVPGLNRKLLGLGAPILFQDVIISVGGLAVQFVINGYGFLFVAGFTATNKLYGVLEMAAISYGYAVVSYVGQNLGAGKIGRIKKGVHASAFLAFLTSAFISIMMFLFGKTLLSMFISGDPAQTEQVLAIAWHYLSIMASCLCILYFLYVYRSALQGLGNTMIPMLSGVVEFFVRVGVALLLPKLVGQNGIFYAEIAAWTGATVLLVVSYYISIRKFKAVM